MNLEKITDRVYANTEGKSGGNVGVIVLKDRAVAVDSQYPVSAKAFRSAIEKLTPKKVTHLFLTHYHGDHVLGSQAFEDCEIVAHRLLKVKMENQLKNEWSPLNFQKTLESMKARMPERAHLFEGLRIVLPSVTFGDYLSLTDGETTIEMIHTGGHSDCSTIVYIPNDKTLFAGDNLFAKTFPFAGDATVNPDKWIEALEQILKMDVDYIIPGHGPVSDKSEVMKHLSFFKAVRDELKKMVKSGISEEDAIRYTGYPEFYQATGDRRENSLRQWYRFYSAKT
ncbi:MAG: MBL fold metallo-hydrolase [Candidatus Bathyarchaeia archaeon]